MTLSPQDIQSKQFHVRFRGFDVEEVDNFLEKIATSLLAVTDENDNLKSRIETLEKDMAIYQTQEKSFQSAIMAAQNIADEMKEKSKLEADQILDTARQEAFNLTDEAHAEIADLERDLDRLKDIKSQITDELRQKIQSYMDMLDNSPLGETTPATEYTPQSSEPLTTPVPEESQASEPSAETTTEEDDLSDLYVKVDLPDIDIDNIEADEDILETQDLELPPLPDNNDLLDIEDDDAPEAAIPDLDGDMVFSLEDPLDDDEPSITFEDVTEKETEEEFDPNESPL